MKNKKSLEFENSLRRLFRDCPEEDRYLLPLLRKTINEARIPLDDRIGADAPQRVWVQPGKCADCAYLSMLCIDAQTSVSFDRETAVVRVLACDKYAPELLTVQKLEEIRKKKAGLL